MKLSNVLYKTLLSAALLAGSLCGQTAPVPLLTTRIDNITANWRGECGAGTIDNRSAARRGDIYHALWAYGGTGTWSVTIRYSNVSCAGPWSTYGAAATINQLSSPAMAFGWDSVPMPTKFVNISITGDVSVTYVGQHQLPIPVGGGDAGGSPPYIVSGLAVSSTPTTITHNLGQLNVLYSFFDSSTHEAIQVAVTGMTLNTLTITTAVPETIDGVISTGATSTGSAVFPCTVSQGCLGLTTVPAHSVIVGNEMSPPNTVSPGAVGTVLTSNGSGSDPTYQASDVGTSLPSLSYVWSQTPGGTLSVGWNIISLSPCPLGVNAANPLYHIYLSGGSGTAEAPLVTGGTCVAGSNGTLTFTNIYSHSGAWTVGTATDGVQEALWAASTTTHSAYITAGVHTVHARTVVPTKTALLGAGIQKSILQIAAGEWSTGVQWQDPELLTATVVTTTLGSSNILMQDFTVDGNASAQGAPPYGFNVTLSRATFSRINHVEVTNVKNSGAGFGVMATNSSDNVIENSIARGNGGSMGASGCIGGFFVQSPRVVVRQSQNLAGCDDGFIANGSAAVDVKFIDNLTNGSNNNAFHAEMGAQVLFEGNTCLGNAQACYDATCPGCSSIVQAGIQFVGNYGTGAVISCLTVQGSTGVGRIRGATITGNTCENNNGGIVVVGLVDGVTISGNVARGNIGGGIAVVATSAVDTPSNIVIADNITIDNGSSGAPAPGILIIATGAWAPGNNITITGNQSYDSRTSGRTQSWGLQIQPDNGPPAHYIISNNNFTHNLTGGISLTGGCGTLSSTSIIGQNLLDGAGLDSTCGSGPTYQAPFNSQVNSADYNFAPQTPGGSLIVGDTQITMIPVPLGVNGTDLSHYLYVSGGTGTAEVCLIDGGLGTSGQASGTIILTCAHAHSGAFTISSASAGIEEAASALSGNGTITLPKGTLNIYARMLLPTKISLIGQGSGATKLDCHTGADQCLAIADGLGTATGQGMGTHSGYTVHGPSSGYGIWIGGDPASVWAPAAWTGSYLRFNDVAVDSFSTALYLRKGNFNVYENSAFFGLTRALFIPSDPNGECQPIQFSNTVLTVDSGAAVEMNHSGYGTCIVEFIGGQVSGTIIGTNVDWESFGAHYESNASNEPLVYLSGTDAGRIVATGGIWSVHGTALADMIHMVGSGVLSISIRDAWIQADVGMVVDNFLYYGSTVGTLGNVNIEHLDFALAGTFTHEVHLATPVEPTTSWTYQWPNLHIATHRVPSIDQINVTDSAGILVFPEGDYPILQTIALMGDNYVPTITAVSGLRYNQSGIIYAFFQSQTFTAGATIGNTITIAAHQNYAWRFDGTKIWIGEGSNGVVNYLPTETGANNAIVASLPDILLTNADGLCVTIKLAHSLQAGANSFSYNGTGLKSIKSSRNPANDIGTAYVSGGIWRGCYQASSSLWLDSSQ